MTQYTVRVNKLNRRKGPVSDFKDKSNITGEIYRGASVEITGEVTNKLGKWLQGNDGNYYWSAGLRSSGDLTVVGNTENMDTQDILNAEHSWAFNTPDGLDIISTWKQGLFGEKVRIAILDSGINTAVPDIMDAVAEKAHDLRSFVPGEGIEDDMGHGTTCASIVVSRGYNVTGVAPKSHLIVAKIKSKNQGMTTEGFLNALKWACEERKADIISMSFNAPFPDPEIGEYIRFAYHTQNKIFVAAVGNGGEAAADIPSYPGNYEGCLSVGAYGENRQICDVSSWNTNLSTVGPGVGFYGYNLSGEKEILTEATSYACPFIAGVLALFLSKFKQNNIPYTAQDLTGKIIYDPVDDGSPELSLKYGKGIINIIQTLQNT